MEILNKRQYTSKTFDNEDGTKTLNAHIGHIHYFDKLDNKCFEEIDWKLVFDEKLRGYSFKNHSYRPFLPEYSDGWAEFRDLFEGKDQTIKYKAIGLKVKGVLVENDATNPAFDDNPDNKGVVYKDVFGKGRDYLLYNTRSSLVKVATINNPNDCKEDAIFEWEVEFPKSDNKELDIYRAEKKEDIVKLSEKSAYKLDLLKEKVFDTKKQTLIGSDKLDGKEWFTYLRSYKAWDSEGNEINIEAKLYVKNGKRYLQKTIPVAFLQKAVGKVFTDTTTSYYAGAGDGIAGGKTAKNPAWDAHDYTTAASFTNDYTSYTSTSSNMALCGNDTGARFFFYRAFFPVDTSSLGSGATITDAALKIYVFSEEHDHVNDFIRLVETNQASSSSLISADYNQCGSVDNPTAGAADVDISSDITITAYNTWTLNATGLSWISKTGTTYLGLREGNDAKDNEISDKVYSGDCNRIAGYFSENTGTDKDPYLSVTYTTTPAPRQEEVIWFN